MANKKVIYVIPGYGGKCSKRGKFGKIARIFSAHDIEPICVDIDWGDSKGGNFPRYNRQFLKAYKKRKGVDTYVLGFSFGAMIAFLTAAKTKPKKILLCSLSPYFTEDFSHLPTSWKKWWDGCFKNSDYSFNDYAKRVISPVRIVVGNKEGKECMRRSRAAKKALKKRATMTVIKGGRHDITQPAYLRALEKVASDL